MILQECYGVIIYKQPYIHKSRIDFGEICLINGKWGFKEWWAGLTSNNATPAKWWQVGLLSILVEYLGHFWFEVNLASKLRPEGE